MFTVLFAVLVPWHPVSKAKETLKTVKVVTGEWKPYTSQEAEGYGIIAKIVTAVLNRMGHQPNYSFMPFASGYQRTLESDTNQGIRGIFPYQWTGDRAEVMYFSKELYKVNNVIFYNPRNTPKFADIKDISTLSGVRAAVPRGYRYAQQIEKILTNKVEVDSEFIAFKRLLTDPNIKIVPAAELVGERIVADYFFKEQFAFSVIPELQWEESLHFIASKRNPHNDVFIRHFDAALEKVQKLGLPDALRRKYRSAQWRRKVVRINCPHGSLMACGRDHPDDQACYALPRGTLAIVLEWGKELLNKKGPRTVDEESNFTKVGIINGPLRGKELYVENIYIELP